MVNHRRLTTDWVDVTVFLGDVNEVRDGVTSDVFRRAFKKLNVTVSIRVKLENMASGGRM